MGIEYIVRAKIFATHSATEKLLSHSHIHEVSWELTGRHFMRGIPICAGASLRSGPLMMGFTADGQIDCGVHHIAARSIAACSTTPRTTP